MSFIRKNQQNLLLRTIRNWIDLEKIVEHQSLRWNKKPNFIKTPKSCLRGQNKYQSSIKYI